MTVTADAIKTSAAAPSASQFAGFSFPGGLESPVESTARLALAMKYVWPDSFTQRGSTSRQGFSANVVINSVAGQSIICTSLGNAHYVVLGRGELEPIVRVHQAARGV